MAALLPSIGVLLSANHVDRAGAIATECAPALDSCEPPRVVFMSLLCRTRKISALRLLRA